MAIAQDVKTQLPNKQPSLRVKTLPNDANAFGDIFGGWLMSQMDIAGWVAADQYSRGPVNTVAVKGLQFLRPLFVYDMVSFYSEVTRVGTTSISVEIEVYAQRYSDLDMVVKVAYATFVYVAISKPGVKRELSKQNS